MAMKKTIPAPDPEAYLTALSGWQRVTVQALRTPAGSYARIPVTTSEGLVTLVTRWSRPWLG